MQTKEDRAAAVGPVRTPTVTNRAADDEERCRMLRADDSRCPNQALPHEPGEPVVCHKHASRVLAFVVKHQQAARTRRTR